MTDGAALPPVCSDCDGSATHHCPHAKCELYLCADCTNDHRRKKTTRDHQLTPLNQPFYRLLYPVSPTAGASKPSLFQALVDQLLEPNGHYKSNLETATGHATLAYDDNVVMYLSVETDTKSWLHTPGEVYLCGIDRLENPPFPGHHECVHFTISTCVDFDMLKNFSVYVMEEAGDYRISFHGVAVHNKEEPSWPAIDFAGTYMPPAAELPPVQKLEAGAYLQFPLPKKQEFMDGERHMCLSMCIEVAQGDGDERYTAVMAVDWYLYETHSRKKAKKSKSDRHWQEIFPDNMWPGHRRDGD